VNAPAAGYSVREVARLLGLSESRVKTLVRAGFPTTTRAPSGWRFAFQDLVLLRTAKALLDAHIPTRRVRRALAALRLHLPQGRPLSSVRIAAVGDSLVVRDAAAQWSPESGQLLFEFAVQPLAVKTTRILRRAHKQASAAAKTLSAADWFALGCELEVSAPDEARDVYRRAIELEPEHADAHVNLGRLLHEAGELASAEAHYRRALAAQPDDVTAAYNLGVVLEDCHRDEEAARAYERVLRQDHHHADAHYNLSGVCERLGRHAAALRHLAMYRRLRS
jgi:tetratricopeptide (TPR) repeat protein